MGSTDTKFTKPSTTDATTTTDGFRVGRRVRLCRENTEGTLVEALAKDVMDRRNWWTVRVGDKDYTHHQGNLELLPDLSEYRANRRVRQRGTDRDGTIADVVHTEGFWLVRWDDRKTGYFTASDLELLPDDEPDAPATSEPASVDDPVSHPRHYTSHPSGIECIEVTRHMGFNLGNAVKYIWRADLKGNSIEDLRKAAWYIGDEIQKRQNSTTSPTTQSLH